MSGELTKRGGVQLDDGAMSRVAESLVVAGDISKLTPVDKANYYIKLCDSLGLNPAAQPFAALKLNGKEVLYPTRGATDQLAAIHKVNREIVDGPRVTDVAGTKVVYALCRATLPNGRIETAVATVPLTDPVNVLMKCETKAKRRATLSILGLAMLDETEFDTIPASAKAPGTPIEVDPPAGSGRAMRVAQGVRVPQAVVDDVDQHCPPDDAGDRARLPLDAAAAILADHEPAMGQEERAAAFEFVLGVCRESVAKLKAQQALEFAKRTAPPPAQPAPAVEAPDPVATIERDYASADTMDDVRAADRAAKALDLAKDDPRLERLRAAAKAARERVSPKPPPKGGKPAPARDFLDDAIEAEREREAIAGEPDDTGARALAAWREHVATKRNEFELAASFLKRQREFSSAGIYDEALRATARALFPMLNTDSENVAISFVREQAKRTRRAA